MSGIAWRSWSCLAGCRWRQPSSSACFFHRIGGGLEEGIEYLIRRCRRDLSRRWMDFLCCMKNRFMVHPMNFIAWEVSLWSQIRDRFSLVKRYKFWLWQLWTASLLFLSWNSFFSSGLFYICTWEFLLILLLYQALELSSPCHHIQLKLMTLSPRTSPLHYATESSKLF